MKKDKVITLKTLTKSSVWEVQENDVFRLWEAAEKDNDLKDNQRKYLDIIRSAFEMEKVTVDRPEVLDKLTERGFKIGTFRIDDQNVKYAIKKRPIMRVTDLTYENVGHITASKLIELLERNFGQYLHYLGDKGQLKLTAEHGVVRYCPAEREGGAHEA